jgi:hypothetical protein
MRCSIYLCIGTVHCVCMYIYWYLMAKRRLVQQIPHFLDNRLIDGCKVVNLTRRSHLHPEEDSWYSFLLEAESTPGP